MDDRVVAVLSTCCDAARAANWRRRVAADSGVDNVMHEAQALVNAGTRHSATESCGEETMRIEQRAVSPRVARQLSRATTRRVALFGDGSDAGGKDRMAAGSRAVFRPPIHRKSSQNAPRPASWRAPERSLGKRASTSVAKSDAVLSGRSLWLKRWSLHTEKANLLRPAGGGVNGGHMRG